MSKAMGGNITGTGIVAESQVVCNRALVSLDFGTGTVTLDWCVDGTNWKPYKSYTADANEVVEFGVAVPIRLNCSAYTAQIAWGLRV
jgi:hypothetical protein